MPPLKAYLEARKFENLLKQQVDPQVCVTELVQGKSPIGKPFYAYIRLKPSEYMDYKMKLERGQGVNPNDYEILEYGWGEEPAAHVRQMMEEKYGVDHDFANKVKILQEEALRRKVAG
jgi:hypothetical protein